MVVARLGFLLLPLVPFAFTAAAAEIPDMAFKPAGEKGFYTFDTGVLRGRVRLNGRSQGITELVHVPSGVEVASGGRLPGLISHYRVFSAGVRYGKAARDWPTVTKVLDDGALEVFWPSGEEHPLEMTAVYRFRRPNTLDVETAVTPQRDMPAFEVFVSSYFGQGFRARVSVALESAAGAAPRFVPVDRKPDSRGGYVTFPRDGRALEIIRDGRWGIPPNPVDWDVVRWLSPPIAVRRDEPSGVTALLTASPNECFAISSPYNPPSPDAGGYRSVYLSLFGRDLDAGQTARAGCRLVVAGDLSDEEAAEEFGRYARERASGGEGAR
ncbi:MAG: hypothetical protein ACYTG0_37165 [Planctomycetota bacterium]|jgi:hypothetical protein